MGVTQRLTAVEACPCRLVGASGDLREGVGGFFEAPQGKQVFSVAVRVGERRVERAQRIRVVDYVILAGGSVLEEVKDAVFCPRQPACAALWLERRGEDRVVDVAIGGELLPFVAA